MKSSYFDDEMFDDLHEGVEALRSVIRTRSIPLSPKAAETSQRLENTVPTARNQFNAWKISLKKQAVTAAQKTDRMIHDHPYSSLLGAFAFGMLVGWTLANTDEAEDDS